MIDDTVGAWMPEGRFIVKPTRQGLLDGLTFAVKDLFHVAGYKTSAGNPTWLTTHPVAEQTSPVIKQLLNQGATLVGKVLTDELAYSINGDNIHYGTPINVKANGRVTGGSSNGSAAAVAAKLCDFALATDTGGSTRVPASYCGIWGLRTTQGLISTEQMVPLHPSFDTVNWLADNAETFGKVAEALCPQLTNIHHAFRQVKMSSMLWQLADSDFQLPLQQVTDILCKTLETLPIDSKLTLANESLNDWRQAYVDAGAYEAWQTHGDWITTHQPIFSDAIANRWQYAKQVTKQQRDKAWLMIKAIRQHLAGIITDDTIMVMPSSATIALPINSRGEAIDSARTRTMQLTCVAGITGLPQVNIPLANQDNLPLGISLLGPKNSDFALIKLATRIAQQLT